MEITILLDALDSLCVWREVAAHTVMRYLIRMLSAVNNERRRETLALHYYTELYYTLRQEGADSLGGWLEERLKYDEASYPLMVERGEADPELTAAARRDIEILTGLTWVDLFRLLQEKCGIDEALLAGVPRWKTGAPFTFESLTEFYLASGAGEFARYRAFVWEQGKLVPVPDPDPGAVGEMMGYERQREEVIANTRALVEGKRVNNVLLYGDSGTGKSATVKSLLSVPGLEDLRLIQIDKNDLGGLPVLTRTLVGRRHKFILFIDDLAFDHDDKTYSALKSILEGGLEKRPANVAVYATSNRRHLVRQTISERTGDDVDIKETIGEKTSLAERFGVRVAYMPLNKAEYLDLLDRMADESGVTLDRETLHQQGLQWERYHPGRTPRTARQFLDSLYL